MFTGWERSRAHRFVCQVLDELRGAKRNEAATAGLGALIQAIAADQDEEPESVEPARGEEGLLDAVTGKPLESHVRKAGCMSRREYNTMSYAQREATKKGREFDRAGWLAQYRARQEAAK